MVDRKKVMKEAHQFALTMFLMLRLFLQDLDSDQRRKDNGHEPGYQKGHRDHGEQGKRIFTASLLAKPMGTKPKIVTIVPVSIGKAVEV